MSLVLFFNILVLLIFFFPQSFIAACRKFWCKGSKIPEISVCNVNCDLTSVLALITVSWNSCALRNTDYDKSTSTMKHKKKKKEKIHIQMVIYRVWYGNRIVGNSRRKTWKVSCASSWKSEAALPCSWGHTGRLWGLWGALSSGLSNYPWGKKTTLLNNLGFALPSLAAG